MAHALRLAAKTLGLDLVRRNRHRTGDRHPDLYRIGLLGSGFKAHLLCSGVFVSRRESQSLLDEDLTGPGYQLLNYFDAKLEPEAKRVTASFHGLAQQTAIYRQGLGCTLIDGRTEEVLRAEESETCSFPLPR